MPRQTRKILEILAEREQFFERISGPISRSQNETKSYKHHPKTNLCLVNSDKPVLFSGKKTFQLHHPFELFVVDGLYKRNPPTPRMVRSAGQPAHATYPRWGCSAKVHTGLVVAFLLIFSLGALRCEAFQFFFPPIGFLKRICGCCS